MKMKKRAGSNEIEQKPSSLTNLTDSDLQNFHNTHLETQVKLRIEKDSMYFQKLTSSINSQAKVYIIIKQFLGYQMRP